MPNLDELLRVDGAAWRQAVDAGATPARPRRRTPVLLTVAATVLLIAGVVTAIMLPRDPRDGPVDGPGTRSVTFAGLAAAPPSDWTFDVPSAWKLVRPTFATGALWPPAGWLTNQQPGEQCHGAAGCGNPISELADGGVVVSVTGGPAYPRLDTNRTIAGLAAQVTTGDPGQCPGGTVSRSDVRFEAGPALIACFGSGADDQRAKFDAMLETVRVG